MKRALFALTALLMLVSVSAFAQTVPAGMDFQGRLAKPDGTPVSDGAYTIQFSLYTDPSAGSLLWQKSVSGIAAHNGAVAVRLDFSSGFQNGATLTSVFSGSPIYLAISINGAAALAPRQQFLSNGYAFTANTALSVASGSVTGAGIAAGTITADKFAANILNPIAWLLGGNFGTNGAQFLGTNDNQPLAFKVNGRQAMRYIYAVDSTLGFSGVNILGGWDRNSISAGVTGATLAGGGFTSSGGIDFTNTISNDFGVVGGGYNNAVSGFGAAILGGYSNSASGDSATVSGGNGNNASGNTAVIGGGYNNTAHSYAVVGGGYGNAASGSDSTVAGGITNTASKDNSVVSGGSSNMASGNSATVSGGAGNLASGLDATVAGGLGNTAAGQYSFAAGNQAKANHDGVFVWSDSQSPSFLSTGVNQFLIRAAGGVGINTNSPSGFALKVNGAISCASLTQTSDVRYKTHIGTLNNALGDVLSLRGVAYDFDRKKWPAQNFPTGRQIGFIAQELEKIFPELVQTDANGYKSVMYQNMTPVLVEAIKTLKSQLDDKQRQIDELKAQAKENMEIKKQLAELARAMQKMQDERSPAK